MEAACGSVARRSRVEIVVRNLTSVFIALALAAVLLGSGCLACWTPSQKSAHCCKKTGECEKPGKIPVHSQCATQGVDLAGAERSDAAAPVDVHAVMLAVVAAPVVRAVVAAERPPSMPDPDYSPPDLFILNSSLTI